MSCNGKKHEYPVLLVLKDHPKQNAQELYGFTGFRRPEMMTKLDPQPETRSQPIIHSAPVVESRCYSRSEGKRETAINKGIELALRRF